MAIQDLRLPNGEVVSFDEWSHWPRYSTVDCAAANAGSFTLNAFSYVVGGRVPAAGLASRLASPSDTNQQAKRRMNQDEALLVFSWTYEIFALTDYTVASDPVSTLADAPIFNAQNLRRLQRDVVLSFVVGAQIKKPVARSPLSWVGQGPGSPAAASGDAVGTVQFLNYGTGGRATPQNQRLWAMPIHIDSDRVFYVEVKSWQSPGPGASPTLDAVTQAFSMRIYLDGLHRRSVA